MKNIKNNLIHFIGIGGISMSSLAIYMHKLGYKVQGSDLVLNENTKLLQKLGIKVFINHDSNHLKNVDICVYTSAINESNEELKFALKHCKVIERSKLLAKICEKFDKTIAISGTHGKTTTTAMIAQTFCMAGLNPTVHIGGNFKYINGNFKYGDKDFIITEACEYKKSFLDITPDYLIINNVELDHLDCYKDLNDVENTFFEMAKKSRIKVFINSDSQFYKIYKNKLKNCISFGENIKSDYRVYNIRQTNSTTIFDIEHNNEYLTTIKLKTNGKYNAKNALSCIALCYEIGIPIEKIKQALEAFEGVERRLEKVAVINEITIIKDYAHHPTEITNVINNIKTQNYSCITVIFQPHTYSRTKGLFNEFLTAFDESDNTILVPTYPAREQIIEGGKSEDLFNALKQIKTNVYFANSFCEARQLALRITPPNACILLLGAGNIEKLFNN